MGSIPKQDVFDIDAFVSSVTSLYERLISFESYNPSDELMALYDEISKTVLTPVSPVVEEQVCFSRPHSGYTTKIALRS